MAYPNTLDTFINPSGTSVLTSPDHALQHLNINDAVEAIETKLGINNSVDTSSVDYKISLLTNLKIYNVIDYGATGDGTTDDSTAIQAAIDAVPDGEAGIIYFPRGRYYTTAVFILPRFVTILGQGVGLYGTNNLPWGTYPPTYGDDLSGNDSLFLVTNTANPFITVNNGSRVIGVSFFYPNQVAPTAVAPTVYPATIQDPGGPGPAVDVTLSNLMFYNSYDAINLRGSDRHKIEWIFGDPIRYGIQIDYCHDASRIENVHFHDFVYGSSTNIGAWKLSNGAGIIINRSDAQILHNIFVWRRSIGIVFNSGAEGASFGVASNMEFDACDISVEVNATQSQSGWDFTNLHISQGARPTVTNGYGVLVQTADLAKISINGGRMWASGSANYFKSSNSNPLSQIMINGVTFNNGVTDTYIDILGSANLGVRNCFFEGPVGTAYSINTGTALTSVICTNNVFGTNLTTNITVGTAKQVTANNLQL